MHLVSKQSVYDQHGSLVSIHKLTSVHEHERGCVPQNCEINISWHSDGGGEGTLHILRNASKLLKHFVSLNNPANNTPFQIPSTLCKFHELQNILNTQTLNIQITYYMYTGKCYTSNYLKPHSMNNSLFRLKDNCLYQKFCT